MFCKSCGVQLPDGAKFCNSCGANLSGEATGSTMGTTVVSNQGKRKKAFAFVVAAVAAVLVIALLFNGGKSYEKTVDAFFEGLFEADAELYVSTISNEIIDNYIENQGYRNKSDVRKELQKEFDDLVDSYDDDLGKNWKYEYEIIDADEDDEKVELRVVTRLKGKKGEETATWEMCLVKDGNKWYVDNFYQD